MKALLFYLVFWVGFVQAESPLNVQSLSFKGKIEQGGETKEAEDGMIVMPFVQAKDGAVASSINDQVFTSQLGMIAPKHADAYFTAGEGFNIDGMASQNFSVSRNDDRILTIIFDNEGCGAYCENYQVIYSFDVKTGNKIAPEDVFSADGIHSIEHRLKQARQAEYRKYLVSYRKDLSEALKRQDANAADTVSDLKERIDLVRDCSHEGEHTDRTPRAVEVVQGFAYEKFEFGKKEFRLIRERCSNHAVRALDDMGDFTLAIPYTELSSYLTEYGKTLLLDKNAKHEKSPLAENDVTDEAMLFFSDLQSYGWKVGGEKLTGGNGWWVLACEQVCSLHATRLQVSDASRVTEDEASIPAQILQWSPLPQGNVIGIFKPMGVLAAMPLKAGVVKTWLHSGMESYPPNAHIDTMEIMIPLENNQSAVLVPRVISAGSEQIDTLELRAYGQRQVLPGYQLSSADSIADEKQLLPWAGDLDGDGKLDLIIDHNNHDIDVAVYLSSLAQPGELVGLAGSMKYTLPESVEP